MSDTQVKPVMTACAIPPSAEEQQARALMEQRFRQHYSEQAIAARVARLEEQND
jgi:hypothetical protein